MLKRFNKHSRVETVLTHVNTFNSFISINPLNSVLSLKPDSFHMLTSNLLYLESIAHSSTIGLNTMLQSVINGGTFLT